MRWQRIKTAARSTWGRRWALRFLQALTFVALFSTFLANDRPILASYQDELCFPVFREIGELISGPRPYTNLPGRSWSKAETDWAIWPPVPYNAAEMDFGNARYRSPFGEQQIKAGRSRHWLGTDERGRDVLAGMIRGSRVALSVGLIAMSIALLIGILLGGFAGFFANDGLSTQRYTYWSISAGFVSGMIYLFVNFLPYASKWNWLLKVMSGLIILAGIIAFFLLIGWITSKSLPWFRNQIAVPLDSLVMRLIELFNSFPTLILLIAILPIIENPSILTVMLVIGLIRWTGIARFVRAELLRIRQLPYIDAARLSGFGKLRILFRHALPNALGPVVVALSFGVAGAILLEAYLSFLSIGLAEDQVSWGSLLRQSKGQPMAWWLAVFPGLAIFFTVLSLNILGEALRD